MKMLIHLAAVFACAAAQAQTMVISVPPREAWCASSQPLELKPDDDKGRFGDVLFMALYERVERAALASHVASLGVPFLQSMTQLAFPVASPPTPSNAPAAAAGTAAPVPPPAPKVTMSVCSNVPSGSTVPGPPHRIEVRVIPGTRVYASLCKASEQSQCREAIKQKLHTDLQMPPSQSDRLHWRVSQSINGKADADSVLASLVDSSARSLIEGKSANELPRDLLIVWVAP